MAAPIILPVELDTRTIPKQVLDAIQRAQKVASRPIRFNIDGRPLGKISSDIKEFDKSLAASNARVIAFGATTGILYGITRAFGALVQSTILVEKKLKDIQVLTGGTQANFNKLSDSIFKVAKNTSQSFEEAASATEEFARQGLSLKQSIEATNASLILARLSGIKAAEAVKSLTAAFNTFKGEALDRITIVNKMASVDASFAVSQKDLADAISRAGSSAQDAKVSFDELLGIVTSVQQTTARGGAVIGNALKTIFTRLQTAPTLNALKAIGVEVESLPGQLLPAKAILENLAKAYTKLGDVQKNQIARQVAGIQQINILKALLADAAKNYSVLTQATEDSKNATNEAILRNEELNKTLDALIKQTGANITSVFAKIGSITIEPTLKSILKSFNGFFENLENDASRGSFGTKLGEGILKGIGDAIGGPGKVLLFAVFLKLFTQVTSFAVRSIKDLAGLNKGAQEQKEIQSQINSLLSSGNNYYARRLAATNDVKAQEQIILELLKAQNLEIQRQNVQFGGAAVALSKNKDFKKSRQNVETAAGGLTPSIVQEAIAIRKGVGGAGLGAVPKPIHGFKFGNGKVGTVVANTSEYIVENFGGGAGSAVFNQDMIKTIGGVKNLNKYGKVKKVAADGFVPYFGLKQFDSFFGSALVRRNKGHAAIEGLETHVSGQGHSRFVYEDLLKELGSKGVKIVTGKLLPQFKKPRGKGPSNEIKAMFPQIIRAGMTKSSDLRVGNEIFKFTGANFEKELAQQGPAIIKAMSGIGGLIDTDLTSYLATGLLPSLKREKALTGENPRIGFDKRLPGKVGVFSPSQGTLSRAIDEHLLYEPGRNLSNLKDTGKAGGHVPSFAPTLSPTELFKIKLALDGLKDSILRLNKAETERLNRIKRDELQQKAQAGESLTPSEKAFLTRQGKSDRLRELGISPSMAQYVGQIPQGRSFLNKVVNEPVRRGNAELYRRSEQTAIMKEIAGEFRKELSKGIFSGGLLGTGGVERRIQKRFGGKLGGEAQAFLDNSLVNLNQNRFEKRQSFGLNASLTLPIIAESISKLIGVNSESRAGRTTSGIIESVTTGSAVAALAPNKAGFGVGALLATVGILRSITTNTGKTLEKFSEEISDVNGKLDEQASSISETINAFDDLKTAGANGASTQAINRQLALFTDAFSRLGSGRKEDFRRAFISGNIDEARNIQIEESISGARQKKANDFLSRLANFNEKAGTSSNLLGQIVAPSRQGLVNSLNAGGNDTGANITNSLFSSVAGSAIDKSTLSKFLPRMLKNDLDKVLLNIQSLPFDVSSIDVNEVKQLIGKNVNPGELLKAIFEKSKLPTDLIDKVTQGTSVDDLNAILLEVYKKLKSDKSAQSAKNTISAVAQNTTKLVKLTEDIFSDVAFKLDSQATLSQATRDRAAIGAEAALDLRRNSLTPSAFAESQLKINNFKTNTETFGNISKVISDNLRRIDIPRDQLQQPEVAREIASVVNEIIDRPENLLPALNKLATALEAGTADKDAVKKVRDSVGQIGREVGKALQDRDISLGNNKLQKDITQTQISRERALGFLGGDSLGLRNRDFTDITKGAYAFNARSGLNNPIFNNTGSAFDKFFNPTRNGRIETARNANILTDKANTILALDKEKLIPESGEEREKYRQVIQDAIQANLTYAIDQLDSSGLPAELKTILANRRKDIPEIARIKAEEQFPSNNVPDFLINPLDKLDETSKQQYDTITSNIAVVSGNTEGLNKLQAEIKTLSDQVPTLINSIDALVKNALGGETPAKARGHIPSAYAREMSAISRGVGGARAGDRPALRNIRGLGSAVVNSGEKIIRNFMGSGKDAVFNRNMLDATGGLIHGLGSVENVAGGHIPNLAGGLSRGGLVATSNLRKFAELFYKGDADFEELTPRYQKKTINKLVREGQNVKKYGPTYGLSDVGKNLVYLNRSANVDRTSVRNTLAHERFHARNPFFGQSESLARFAGGFGQGKNVSLLSRIGSGLKDAGGYNLKLLLGQMPSYGSFFNRNQSIFGAAKNLVASRLSKGGPAGKFGGGAAFEPIFGDKFAKAFSGHKGKTIVTSSLGSNAQYYKDNGYYRQYLIEKAQGFLNKRLLKSQGYTPYSYDPDTLDKLIRYNGSRKSNAFYFSPGGEGGYDAISDRFKSGKFLAPESKLTKLTEARGNPFLPATSRYSDALKSLGVTYKSQIGGAYPATILKPIDGLQSQGIIRPGEAVPSGIKPSKYLAQEAYQLQGQRSFSKNLAFRLLQKGNNAGLDYSNLFAGDEYRSHVATGEGGKVNSVRYSTANKSSPIRSLIPNLYESEKIRAIERAASNAVGGLASKYRGQGQVFGVDVARIDPAFAEAQNKALGYEKFTSYKRGFIERVVRGNFSQKRGYFGALELNPSGAVASGNASHILETQAFLAGAKGQAPIHALDQIGNKLGASIGRGASRLGSVIKSSAGRAASLGSSAVKGVSSLLVGNTITNALGNIGGKVLRGAGKAATPLAAAIEGIQTYGKNNSIINQGANSHLQGYQKALAQAAGYGGAAFDTLSALDPTALLLGNNKDDGYSFKLGGGKGFFANTVKDLVTQGTALAQKFDPSIPLYNVNGDEKMSDYLRSRVLDFYGGATEVSQPNNSGIALSGSGTTPPPYDISKVNPEAVKFLSIFDKSVDAYAGTGQYNKDTAGGISRGLSAIQSSLGKGGGDADTRAYYEDYLKQYKDKQEGRNQTMQMNYFLRKLGDNQSIGSPRSGIIESSSNDSLPLGVIGVNKDGSYIYDEDYTQGIKGAARGFIPNFARSIFGRRTRNAIRSIGGIVDSSRKTVGPLTLLQQMINGGNTDEARQVIVNGGLPSRYADAGYGANDLGALAAAIEREKESLLARGISRNLASGYIFTGSRPEIGGVGVGNYLDEPAGRYNPNLGILQGINRVRSQGGNPRSSGVPNYAKEDDKNFDELIVVIRDLIQSLSNMGGGEAATSSVGSVGGDVKVEHNINVNASINGEIKSTNDSVSQIVDSTIAELKARILALEAAQKNNRNFVPRPPGTSNVNI